MQGCGPGDCDGTGPPALPREEENKLWCLPGRIVGAFDVIVVTASDHTTFDFYPGRISLALRPRSRPLRHRYVEMACHWSMPLSTFCSIVEIICCPLIHFLRKGIMADISAAWT